MVKEPPKITLAQLRTLIEVAESHSFTPATGTSRSSAIAVRGILARLSEAAGDRTEPLAHSVGGHVELTPRGQQMLSQAQRVLGLVDKLADLDRPVRVAAYSSLMLQLLLRWEGGNLPFVFTPSDAARSEGGIPLIQRLKNYDIDIALAPSGFKNPTSGFDEPRLVEVPMYMWRLRAVGTLSAQELSTLDGIAVISVEALAKHPLLVSPVGYRSRALLESAATLAGARLNIPFDLSDQGIMRGLAAVSKWIAVIPDDAFGHRDDPIGVPVVFERKVISGSYSMYYHYEPGDDDHPDSDFQTRTKPAIDTIIRLMGRGDDRIDWPSGRLDVAGPELVEQRGREPDANR